MSRRSFFFFSSLLHWRVKFNPNVLVLHLSIPHRARLRHIPPSSAYFWVGAVGSSKGETSQQLMSFATESHQLGGSPYADMKIHTLHRGLEFNRQPPSKSTLILVTSNDFELLLVY
jgi:hypothetical protein